MKKSIVAALLCGVVLVQPAWAGAVVPATAAAAKSAVAAVQPAVGSGSAEVIDVRWRRHHHHRHRHRGVGAFGAGLAVGIIGALVAKGISESAARERYDRCAVEFRSFDPETGTYITRSGEERLCPYLR